MSIAINTIILFFLFLLPGLLFRRGYYSKTFSKQYIKTSSLDIFMSSIIPGVIIQVGYTLFINRYVRPINFDAVVNITSSSSETFKSGIDVLIRDFSEVSCFFLVQISFAWLFGRFCKTVVRKFGIDLKSKIFRFRNKWHYILTGEITQFPENNLKEYTAKRAVYNTWVDALVNVDSRTILYSGLLSDYHLTDNGHQLEHIELISIRKREFLTKDESSVASSTMIIPYTNVLNLNLLYVEDIDRMSQIRSKTQKIYRIYNSLTILLILGLSPFFFIDIIQSDLPFLSEYYLSTSVPYKIVSLLLVAQVLGLTLSVENDEKVLTYKRAWWLWVINVVLILFLFLLLYWLK